MPCEGLSHLSECSSKALKPPEIPYSGETFEGENFRELVQKYEFHTFADCSLLLDQRMPSPKFHGEPRNSQKFSPSKVFHYTVTLTYPIKLFSGSRTQVRIAVRSVCSLATTHTSVRGRGSMLIVLQELKN